MTQISMGKGLSVEFEANDHKYSYGYHLTEDIYPKWCTFVKQVVGPKCKK
jgi:hypothetical protein